MPALLIPLSRRHALALDRGAASQPPAVSRQDEHPSIAHHQTAGADDRPSLILYHLLDWRGYVFVSPPKDPCPIQKCFWLAPERASVFGPPRAGTTGDSADTCGCPAEHRSHRRHLPGE